MEDEAVCFVFNGDGQPPVVRAYCGVFDGHSTDGRLGREVECEKKIFCLCFLGCFVSKKPASFAYYFDSWQSNEPR
jgi:hypothetical protein